MSRYPLFDRSKLQLRPLSQRRNELSVAECLRLDDAIAPYDHPEFADLVCAIVQARQAGRPIIWMIGAHVIKAGLSRFLVDLIERGWITHLATNGAGIIHDYELALQGGTSEDVAANIKQGDFGMWAETGRINDIVREAAAAGEGLGEAVGRTIHEGTFTHRELSVCAAGWRRAVPVTCHVGVGCDIIHQHANCDGAAFGAASYTDFLIFTRSVSDLEGGVFLNIGSAVTGPEVYLKSLSMARNVARQEHRSLCRFTTAVFDLVPLPPNCRDGTAAKTHPQYYYRPWKTILVRTVADGGQSYYFCGDHRVTIPNLHQRLTASESSSARSSRAA
jgi:hypothetical protein